MTQVLCDGWYIYSKLINEFDKYGNIGKIRRKYKRNFTRKLTTKQTTLNPA